MRYCSDEKFNKSGIWWFMELLNIRDIEEIINNVWYFKFFRIFQLMIFVTLLNLHELVYYQYFREMILEFTNKAF